MNAKHTLLILLAAISVGCNPNIETSTLQSAANTTLADTQVKSAPQNTIKIGGDINAARKQLDMFEKFNSVGGFAFGKHPEDVENIFVQLDADHMNACIWYSKSTQQITRMNIVCFPKREAGKLYKSWIPIQSIDLNDDGTHTLTFSKPLTIAELDNRDAEAKKHQLKSQLPPRGKGFQ